jgi:hypothetical protein
MSKCVICKKLAVTKYEGHSSCGLPKCEYQIQEGLDYIKDIGSH